MSKPIMSFKTQSISLFIALIIGFLLIIYFVYSLFFAPTPSTPAIPFAATTLPSPTSNPTTEATSSALTVFSRPLTKTTNEFDISLDTIDFQVLDTSSFPSQLPILTVNESTNQILADKLALVCQNGSHTYDCYPYNKQQFTLITKNDNAEQEELLFSDQAPIITLVEAQQIASAFLADFPLAPGGSLYISSISYLSGGVEPTLASDPATANIVLLRLNQLYNNIPLLFRDSSASAFNLYINRLTGVQKAELQTQNLTVTGSGVPQTLLSLPEAIAALSRNEGYLLSISNFESYSPGQNLDLQELTDFYFNQVDLEYRYDENLGSAIPSYNFSGFAHDSNNNSVVIEIITPAINLHTYDL